MGCKRLSKSSRWQTSSSKLIIGASLSVVINRKAYSLLLREFLLSRIQVKIEHLSFHKVFIETMNDLPHLLCLTQNDWEQWLEENHTSSQGVWLKHAKKAGGKQSVSYQEALEVALCFGWIDGQKNKLDDEYFLQKFTPRRKKSMWSQINREKVAKLIEDGKMREAGLREIEAAKADGRWDAAYEPASKMTVPEDVQAALDANPAAKAFFEQLNKANRYAILYRIQNVKKAETRQRKITEFIQMLAENRKIHD